MGHLKIQTKPKLLRDELNYEKGVEVFASFGEQVSRQVKNKPELGSITILNRSMSTKKASLNLAYLEIDLII